MAAKHADRLWMLAGAAVIVFLAVMSWFFVISPKYAEADDVLSTTADTQTQIISLRKRIAELEMQKSKLPQFKQALKRNQAALPSDSGVPDFLRQLQDSGDQVNVSVGGINVSAPSPVSGSATIYSLPITLSADGSATSLDAFLRQLQETQPRAVLIESVNVTAQNDSAASGGAAGDLTMSVSLKAFVAVPVGAGAPSITTN